MKAWFQRLIRRLLGWYIDPILEECRRLKMQIAEQNAQLEEQCAMMEGQRAQIEEQIARIERQKTLIEEQSARSDEQKLRLEAQNVRINELTNELEDVRHPEWYDQLTADCANAEERMRERLEEQNGRLLGIEQWKERTTEALEKQITQLTELESRGRFTKENVAENARRLSDIEHREEWTRQRFEGHDHRLSDIEHREEWTRERFEGHDQRLSDIEHREEWTRKRFEGHDEKIYEFIRWNSILEAGQGIDLSSCYLGNPDEVPPSRLCTANELLSRECQQYRDALRIDEVHALLDYPHFSRREWEFETICNTLDAFGMLAQGKTGIGFAVGQEPLPAYFALRGCMILASDLDPAMDTEGLWSETNQNAMGDLSRINQFGICPPDQFEKLVSYRNIDMNTIPEDVGKFDFCWSTCAIEHIGGLDQSIRFLKNMLNVLKPGGVAVHTTEINLSSNISTIERGNSVIFRDRDIRDVYEWMTAHGHKMSVNLTRGNAEMDLRRSITGKKYTDYMLNCNIEGYDSTSFVFIIVKNDSPEDKE